MDFNKIEGYCPFVGFYDLREFNLPKKVFSALWKVQEYLSHMRDNQEYFKKMDKNTWEAAKNLSAEYQQRLFSYKKELRK